MQSVKQRLYSTAALLGASMLSAWCALISYLAVTSIHPIADFAWDRDSSLLGVMWLSIMGLAAFFTVAPWRERHLADRRIAFAFFAHLMMSVLLVNVLIGQDHERLLANLIIFSVDVPVFFFFIRNSNRSLRDFKRQMVLASLVVPTLVLLIWSVGNIALVARAAWQTANERPFCLQIPKDRLGRYTQVTSWWQLSGLRMQVPFTEGGASGDYQFAFHAVLVVENGARPLLYNWSHRAQAFLPISDETRSMKAMYDNCAPQALWRPADNAAL